MAAQAGVDLGQEIPAAATSGKEAVNAKAAEMKAASKAKQKQSPIKSLLKDISNIFVPMIPAFVGAGLVAGDCFCYDELDHCRKNRWRYVELLCHDFKYLKKTGCFSYLVIFTGVNAAQVFKSEPNARRCHWVRSSY